MCHYGFVVVTQQELTNGRCSTKAHNKHIWDLQLFIFPNLFDHRTLFYSIESISGSSVMNETLCSDSALK